MNTIEGVSLEPAPQGKLPRCPYCKAVLETIWVKSQGWGIKGEEVVLMCPHCEALLGYNAWKR